MSNNHSDLLGNTSGNLDGLKTPPRRLLDWDEDMSESSGKASDQAVDAIPLGIRRRVDEIERQGRCLIENVSPYRAVDYAHYVPQKLSEMDDMLTFLEYYWDMKYQSLNLDTRHNIFRVGASLHTMFDNSMWMLVPEEDVVDRFISSLKKHGSSWYAVRSAFPKFQEKTFNYRLVPISDEMKAITIPRQNNVGPIVQPTDVTVHFYPFQTLPLLESHIQPNFVIFEAGRRIRELENLISSLMFVSREAAHSVERLVEGLRTQWPMIERIERIYHAWMRRLDLTYILADPTFNPPTPANPEDNASKGNNYIYHTPPRKRKTVDARDSSRHLNLPHGTSASCKSQRQRDHMPFDSRNLSKRTLQSWDRAQGRKWTRESIASWSADCTADADDGVEA